MSRRSLLCGLGGLALGGPASASGTGAADAPVELHMRLANPPQDRPTVIVTLDACPGAFDARLAGALAQNDIPASLFVSAGWIRRNPKGLAFFLGRPDLFRLENHGWRHTPPVLGRRRIFGIAGAADLAAVREEVERGAASVEAACGARPQWYRAGTGFYSPSALPDIARTGEGIAAFSLNGDMGASLPAAQVARRIARARSGDVIVAHVNQPLRASGPGVAVGLLRLRARGYRFARLDAFGPGDFVYDLSAAQALAPAGAWR